MNRGLFANCLIILTLFAVLFQTGAAEAAQKKKRKVHRPALAITPINQQNPKYASIVIDAETGTIIHQDNPDALRHPASLTKMMTLLLVFDALDSGRLQPSQRIKISQHAASMPPSKLGLRPGSGIRVDDAILALVTQSANDIAVALAEAVGGSESQFASRMNARAASIGMTRSRFYNASGLPNQSQVTTARDMARLARFLLANYPQQSRVFSTLKFTYNGHTYNNHNRLMETYAGMDCCKTGYINASGFNLVASAKRNGTRVIGVVFGGRSTASRNVHMASLLDDGFEKVRHIQATQIAAAKAATQGSAGLPANPQRVEKDVVLASVAPEHQIIQEAYMNAREPVQDNAPLEIKKLAQQPAPIKRNPAQKSVAPATAPSQTLGTIPLSAISPQATQNPYAAIQPSSPAVPQPAAVNSNSWAIQIGAYQTREATDQAIYQAQQKLPAHLQKSQALVVPLRTADANWMFRARLSGFSQAEANEACKYFKGCLAISPQAY